MCAVEGMMGTGGVSGVETVSCSPKSTPIVLQLNMVQWLHSVYWTVTSRNVAQKVLLSVLPPPPLFPLLPVWGVAEPLVTARKKVVPGYGNATWGHSKKVTTCEPGRALSPEASQPPELSGYSLLLLRPPSLRCSLRQLELTHRLRDILLSILLCPCFTKLIPCSWCEHELRPVQWERRVLSDWHYWVVPAILARDSGGPVCSSQSLPPEYS